MTQESRLEGHSLRTVHARLKIMQASIDEETHGPGTASLFDALTAFTEGMSAAFDARSAEHMEIVKQLAELRTEVRGVQNDTKSLCKVVRDGNGQPSIIQRLATLETVVSNHDKEIETIGEHANSIVAAKALTRSQFVAGVVGMVVTGLLAGLSLLAQVVSAKGD